LLEAHNVIVKPEGFTIPFNAEKIHGISSNKAKYLKYHGCFIYIKNVSLLMDTCNHANRLASIPGTL